MFADRWWFWMAMVGITVFGFGLSAGTNLTASLCASPVGVAVCVLGCLEAGERIRKDRDAAIREAARLASKVEHMDRIT